jgi:hypothetical protein
MALFDLAAAAEEVRTYSAASVEAVAGIHLVAAVAYEEEASSLLAVTAEEDPADTFPVLAVRAVEAAAASSAEVVSSSLPAA